MLRKITFAALACLAAASIASAQEGCALSADGNDVETKPVTWRSFADAYGIANGHYLIGTADTAPPTPITHPDCGAGTTIGRAAYIGTFESPSGDTLGDGNDMVAVFAFNADEVVASASKHAVRFRSIQNFVGNGYLLTAKILENRADTQGDPGARGLFNRTPVASGSNSTSNGGLGPFGAPNAGVLSTVVADARSDRGDLIQGACTIPAVGTLNIHDSGSGVTYATFDRSADIALASPSTDPGMGGIKDAIVKAQNSGVSYPTCAFSCTAPSPLKRNVQCDITVNNPIYVAVTAVPGGTSTASERLQDTLLVDNIIHLQGDTDFCGENAVGEICSVTLVSKL